MRPPKTLRQIPLSDVPRSARWLPALALLALTGALLTACGPSDEELSRRVAETRSELRAVLSGEALPAAARNDLEQRRAWNALQELYLRGTADGGEGDDGQNAEAAAEGSETQRADARPAELVWVDGMGPRDRADELISLLGGPEAAAGDGHLDDPERDEDAGGGRTTARADEQAEEDAYGARRLAELRDRADRAVEEESPQMARHLADLELAASYAFLARAIHAVQGRVDPRSLNVQWYTEGRKAEPLELLRRVADGAAPAEVLDGLEPDYEGYRRLVEARERYRQIVEAGGWPEVPGGEVLEEGARGPRVAALRQRLAASGDLSAGEGDAGDADASGAVYDAAVTEAVRRFQRRHGLELDGKVGGGTLEELNVPAEERLETIDVNLERWRWMPGSLGDHYIEVNIPEYRLRVVRAGQTEMQMKVIVGKPLNETPVFSDTMSYVVLNPAWNIPESIADSEVVPKIVENPGYAESQGIEVVTASGERMPAASVLGRQAVTTSRVRVEQEDEEEEDEGFFERLFGGGDDDDEAGEDRFRRRIESERVTELPEGYRLRQAPGPENPLGQIKFMFPNEHNIYLHDTPADSMFSSAERGFSHGCIRLEKPLELAQYVLRGDPEWDAERIRRTVGSGERTEVGLPEEIPVHLTYFTARVGEDGQLQFNEDIYGHDERLARALAAEEPLTLDPDALRASGSAVASGGAKRAEGPAG